MVSELRTSHPGTNCIKNEEREEWKDKLEKTQLSSRVGVGVKSCAMGKVGKCHIPGNINDGAVESWLRPC